MGVAAQSSFGLEFTAKILQLVDRQSAFDERSRVHARRGVALEVNQIALVAALATSSEEMVEGDFVEGRTASEGADMAPLPFVFLIGPNDHGHRIPANDALDPSLGLAISRISGLFEGWYGIDVRCRRLDRDLDPIAAGSVFQGLDQIPDSVSTFALGHIIQGTEPLAGFGRIDIDRGLYLSRCHEHRRIRLTEGFCIRHRVFVDSSNGVEGLGGKNFPDRLF